MYILISIILMLGGVLMLIAEHFGKRTRDLKHMTWLDALIVGVWQIVAIDSGLQPIQRHHQRRHAAQL